MNDRDASADEDCSDDKANDVRFGTSLSAGSASARISADAYIVPKRKNIIGGNYVLMIFDGFKRGCTHAIATRIPRRTSDASCSADDS